MFEFTLIHNRDAATALLTVIDLSDQADALLPKVTIGDGGGGGGDLLLVLKS